MTPRRTTVFALALSAVVACSTDRPVGDIPGDETFAERVRAGEHLYVEPYESGITVTGRYNAGAHPVGTATLPVTRGELEVYVSEADVLVLDALYVELEDITVKPTSTPIHLTDLRVELRGQATGQACWAGDLGAVGTQAEVMLHLDWSLVTAPGEAAPLGQQHIGPVVATVRLHEENGHVVATITAEKAGRVWSWAEGLVTLEDLHVKLAAADEPFGPVE